MIGFVICGVEHSGTTLVSDRFRQVPTIDAGFEGGVLLGRSPREFLEVETFGCWFSSAWGLDAAALAACCDTDSFLVFYRRVQDRSTLLAPGTVTIFDKTPRYLSVLNEALARLPVPFIVTIRDPRGLAHANFRRAGAADFTAWFLDSQETLGKHVRNMYMQSTLGRRRQDGRVCLVRLEELCVDTRRACERMFDHVGERFDLAYLAMGESRYRNTRSGSVSAGAAFEYRAQRSAAEIGLVERHWADLADWFYD